jgi:hypothetical protein
MLFHIISTDHFGLGNINNEPNTRVGFNCLSPVTSGTFKFYRFLFSWGEILTVSLVITFSVLVDFDADLSYYLFTL